MWKLWRRWKGERKPAWRQLPVLVLVNGLAEQRESWYCNRSAWERDFDVKVPEILVYDGPQLHRRIADGLPITVPYLADCLEEYLERFVQKTPYYIVASSLGCQVAVELAVRRPAWVARMVLLCPSGFGSIERLPVVEGVRHSDMESLLRSIFHDPRHVDQQMLAYLRERMQQREWKKGLLRTVRGTAQHCVRDQLARVRCPTLVVCGEQDKIVCPEAVRAAVCHLPLFQFILLPSCGHAPQIECSQTVNRLVRAFLLSPDAETPRRTLASAAAGEGMQAEVSHGLG
ncbi:Lipase 3 [bacterium HR36]|nr:Lipase 3 [bacterium HR36]